MIQRFVIGKPFPTESVVLDLPAETGPVPYLTPDGDGWQYVMQEKDIVYGLGEMPRGLNKRGVSDYDEEVLPAGRHYLPCELNEVALHPSGPHRTGGTARCQHRPAGRYGPHLLALRARRPACALPDVYRRRRDHRSQPARTLAHRRTITQKHPEASPGVFLYYRYATVSDRGFLEPWFASGPAPSAA